MRTNGGIMDIVVSRSGRTAEAHLSKRIDGDEIAGLHIPKECLVDTIRQLLLVLAGDERKELETLVCGERSE